MHVRGCVDRVETKDILLKVIANKKKRRRFDRCDMTFYSERSSFVFPAAFRRANFFVNDDINNNNFTSSLKTLSSNANSTRIVPSSLNWLLGLPSPAPSHDTQLSQFMYLHTLIPRSAYARNKRRTFDWLEEVGPQLRNRDRDEAFVVRPRGSGIWVGLNQFGAFTVGYPVGILCTYYRKSQSTANIVGFVNSRESRFP